MDRFRCYAQEVDQGATALVLGLAKAFERVGLPVVWAWATHFEFRRKILRVLCGYFEHQRRVKFGGCLAERLQTITAFLRGQSEATQIYPPLKLRVFVDDITVFYKWQEQGAGGDGRKCFENVENGGRGGGLKAVDH